MTDNPQGSTPKPARPAIVAPPKIKRPARLHRGRRTRQPFLTDHPQARHTLRGS